MANDAVGSARIPRTPGAQAAAPCRLGRSAATRAAFGSRCLLLLAVVLLGLACGPSKERRETLQLLASMDRLRTAKGKARPKALADLQALKLETPKAKQAQKACADAYRKLHEATDIIADLESKRSQGKLDLRALGPLQTSQKMLTEAKQAGKRCEKALTQLKRR